MTVRYREANYFRREIPGLFGVVHSILRHLVVRFDSRLGVAWSLDLLVLARRRHHALLGREGYRV
jgi:hypothetical protein